jgi:hypothetical protein
MNSNTSVRVSQRLTRLSYCAVLVLYGVAAPSAAQTAGNAPSFVWSLAGGPVTDGVPGSATTVRAHAMLGLTYAPLGSRVEARLDAIGWSRGPYTVSGTVIAPFSRAPIGSTLIRPYALAGFATRWVGDSGPMGAHAGLGIRLDSTRAGLFAEMRRFSFSQRTTLSVGMQWRP